MNDPRVELAAVEDELRRLRERQRYLKALVDGPRVVPVAVVWSHGERREYAYFDNLWEAVRFMRYADSEGDCSVECVKVGGYALTEEEADEIAREVTE